MLKEIAQPKVKIDDWRLEDDFYTMLHMQMHF